MTTARSPLRALKAQADNIAAMLKAVERGEQVDVRFAEKIEAARGRDGIKVGVMMDDKLIIVEMPWIALRETSEAGLADYILRQMRGARDAAH